MTRIIDPRLTEDVDLPPKCGDIHRMSKREGWWRFTSTRWLFVRPKSAAPITGLAAAMRYCDNEHKVRLH